MMRVVRMVLCVVILYVGMNTEVLAKQSDDNQQYELIYQFAENINDRNVDAYIELFAPNIQEEMNDYLEKYGRDSFFIETSCTIISIEKGDVSIAIDEVKRFDDVVVYKVIENIEFQKDIERDTCALKEGKNICNFVLVKMNEKWYIYRVSAAEENEIRESRLARSLSTPYSTVIYFTKSENVGHWGYVSKALDFDDEYLRNCLPKEWYISNFSNTAYAYAGTLASKTYAWYFTEHPKWYVSPYYSCMKDDSSDQNYLYSAYNDMERDIYRNREDNALAFAANKVLVKEGTDNVLEVHYHKNEGTQHSGKLNQTECWTKANAGESYEDILHYYYDYSIYSGVNSAMEIRTY